MSITWNQVMSVQRISDLSAETKKIIWMHALNILLIRSWRQKTNPYLTRSSDELCDEQRL